MKQTRPSGFTIVELLVVVAIITLLVGILLPAIGRVREQGRVTMSFANLRNLAAAHQSYAAEWNLRQLTLVNDGIASYGDGVEAFDAYAQANGGTDRPHQHPGLILGWGYRYSLDEYVLFGYWTHYDGTFSPANAVSNLPINFGRLIPYYGSFRLINVQQFHQYVGGRFYDEVFYAPQDTLVLKAITGGGFRGQNCFDDPGEYCDRPRVPEHGRIPVWPSYVTSPAAMFSPDVFAPPVPASRDLARSGGWTDPWSMPGGFRSPAFSQCLYPSLKTHMLEHHWLQNRRGADCNPGFDDRTYDFGSACYPYHFNHAWTSAPATLFYDGHVELVGVREAMRADGRVREQTGSPGWGLWSRDTPWGKDGYLSEYSYDQAQTSFHILTTDGIRGRDITAH